MRSCSFSEVIYGAIETTNGRCDSKIPAIRQTTLRTGAAEKGRFGPRSIKLLQYVLVVYEALSAGYEKAVRKPILRLTPERQLENKANTRLISRALKMALRIQEIYRVYYKS